MAEMLNGAGPHLMLDCYGCNSSIYDLEKVHHFLAKLPGKIDMKILAPPYAFKADKPDDQGITGVTIIETSHISFHSFGTGYTAIDVYSCKDYDEATVIDFVKELFEPQVINKNFVHRGKECQQKILAVDGGTVTGK